MCYALTYRVWGTNPDLAHARQVPTELQPQPETVLQILIFAQARDMKWDILSRCRIEAVSRCSQLVMSTSGVTGALSRMVR